MRYRLLSLLLMALIFLPSYANAGIIETFSIINEKGKEIFMKDGKRVGEIKYHLKGKSHVSKVLYNEKSYFMKEAHIDASNNLELRNRIDSVVASHILNTIFKDKEKRYPLINLAFNAEYNGINNIQPFQVLSEDLTTLGFKSIFEHKKKNEFYPEDLENLYIGMYLAGGGDPHIHNIFYNSENHYLGSVDLDVSFKKHISFFERDKEQYATTHSDLAIKSIKCDNLFANFLYNTDSRFKDKGEHYQEDILLYQSTLKMNEMRLISATNKLRNTFIDNKDLFSIISSIVGDIKKDLKEIINVKLQLDDDEKKSIYDDSGSYFNKDGDTYKKYERNRLVKSVKFLFDKEEDYIQKIYQFVENRYLTLVCIFGNSNNIIVKETCERCLPNPKTEYKYCDYWVQNITGTVCSSKNYDDQMRCHWHSQFLS